MGKSYKSKITAALIKKELEQRVLQSAKTEEEKKRRADWFKQHVIIDMPKTKEQ